MSVRARDASPSLDSPGASLSGLRVVEVTDLAGEVAGKLLADLGADVIKVEQSGGDLTRFLPPFHADHPDPDRSLVFWSYNTNKRSVVIHDRDYFVALVERADVLLVSRPSAFWEEPNEALDDIVERLPRLIVASITPFGPTGPYAGYRAGDSVICAFAGLTYLNGWPDGPPLRPFGPQAAHCAGYAAAIGILAALTERVWTGRGRRVDVSAQEAVLSAIEHAGSRYLTEGVISRRFGTRHWTGGTRVVPARDGRPVLLSLAGDWEALVNWLDHEGLAADLTDPAYRDPQVRHRLADHVLDILAAWATTHDRDDLIEGAQVRRVPFAPVLRPSEVLADPHLRSRAFFVPVAHPDTGRTIEYPRAPFRIEGASLPPLHRAPHLGEHTVEVLEELEASARSFPPPGSKGAASRHNPRAKSATATSRAATLPYALPSGTGSQPSPTPDTRHPTPLRGLRVADFTWVVAGPRTTRILADLGADVIKIERMPDPGTSARDVRGRFDMWGNLNAGKRSVALDLGRPEGRDLARRIIGLSDLVIDNFSPRVMSNLGLDQATLRSARPDLIVVSLAGPGHSGPRRDWVTFGPTIQALTGHTSLIGEPGLPPAGYGFAYVDLMSGSAGALAALAAMEHRRRTGEGCFVDLSQWEVGASLIGPAWLDLTANGREAGQDGRLSPDGPAAPDGIYQCAGDDRWCVITCRDETEWRAFRDTIGPPPWTDDPRFASLADRIAHRAELDALVGAWTRRYPAVELVERLQAVGVPAGVVQDARDLIERDPQLRHRGHWLEQTDPESGPGRVEALPIRIDGEPTPPRGLSPYPGEDTDEVLLDLLGLSRERVARLRTAGIVGGSP